MIAFLILASAISTLATPTTNHDERIVGGYDIPIEDVPYQVSLQLFGGHGGGGSIIAPNYVVTAAHCLTGQTAENFSVRVGTSTRNSGGQVVNVTKMYIHPDWDYNTIDCDIAVLELAENLEYGDKVQPIKLPSRTQTWPAGTEVLASGWGALHANDTSLPVNLQGVTVKLFNQETCSNDYVGQITPNMFCAGVEEGGKDSCGGDSGGPLQVDGILAGVVSWGNECALVGSPGVYANVSVLRDFIEHITGL